MFAFIGMIAALPALWSADLGGAAVPFRLIESMALVCSSSASFTGLIRFDYEMRGNVTSSLRIIGIHTFAKAIRLPTNSHMPRRCSGVHAITVPGAAGLENPGAGGITFRNDSIRLLWVSKATDIGFDATSGDGKTPVGDRRFAAVVRETGWRERRAFLMPLTSAHGSALCNTWNALRVTSFERLRAPPTPARVLFGELIRR